MIEYDPDKCYLLDTPLTSAIMIQLATQAGGVVYPSGGYCRHVINNKKVITYFSPCLEKGRPVDHEVRKMQLARLAMAHLTSMELTDVPWSYGAMARIISNWIGVKEYISDVSPNFLPVWHFQYAMPSSLPHAHVYDMQSAYFQIAALLPSLHVTIDHEHESMLFHLMHSRAEERWQQVKLQLAAHKRLRLAIIGVNSAGFYETFEEKHVYTRDGRVARKGQAPTCFKSLAAATVRIAFELTQLQWKELPDCNYANCDCVVTAMCPKLWSDLGITYREKAAGTFRTLGVGTWKCGHHQTLNYRQRLTDAEALDMRPAFAPHRPKLLSRPVYHKYLQGA